MCKMGTMVTTCTRWGDKSDEALSTAPGTLDTLELLLIMYIIINNNIMKYFSYYQTNGPHRQNSAWTPKCLFHSLLRRRDTLEAGSEDPQEPPKSISTRIS